MDLFKLYVDDLKARYHEEKKLIREILKEKNIEIELSTTYDQFCEILNSDKRMSQVDPSNTKLTFNSLIEKAEQKEKERQKEESKRLKKLEQSFRNVLKKYEVNENSKFDVVKAKIVSEEAYVSINNEKECERIFNEYLTQLQETCLHHVKKKKEKKRSKNKRSRSNSPNEDRSDAVPVAPASSDTNIGGGGTGTDGEDDVKAPKIAKKDDDEGQSMDVNKEKSPSEVKIGKDETKNGGSKHESNDQNGSSKSSKKHKKSKKRKRQKSVGLNFHFCINKSLRF